MPGARRMRLVGSPFYTLRGLFLLPLIIVGCGGESTGPNDVPGPGTGARVVITPGALLLTAVGETMQLTATVLDASGRPVQASVVWQSSEPGTISVSTDGLATANAQLGSAQITAVAQGVTSDPVIALIAQPGAGVMLIPDSLIMTDPVAVDVSADYRPGWQYRIRVRAVTPAAGQLLIGTGGRSLAGRVVAATVQGAETELTVELVPLGQLFADLRIDETIPLAPMPTQTAGARLPDPAAPALRTGTEFTLGRFTCTASGEVPSLDLPDPSLSIQPRLSLVLGYANGLEKYAVVGSITADFGYKPVFKAVFEGSAVCETVLTTATVPLFGPLALFFGIHVPLGVGFGLDGKLEIAEVGFDVSAHAEATAELGLMCPAAGGTCTGATSFEIPEPDFDFEFIAPDPTEQFKVELGAKALLFARPSIGTRFSGSTQFAFLEATAGFKQSIDLATPTRQVSETDYASAFALQGLVDVGPGKDLTAAVERLEELLGTELSVDLTLVAVADTLARSPRGTFTITPPAVEPGNDQALGEMATFTIELDPVTYLGIQSVEKIEFYWKKDDGSGGFTLGSGRPGCTTLSATAGQTKFECQADFLEEHEGTQEFYAFVHAKLFGIAVPIPFEIAENALAKVSVGPAAPAGVIPILNESFSAASTAEYQQSYADADDFLGFSANVSADLAFYGTASATASQTSIFHQATTPGHISRIESNANASDSIVPDEQDRTGGGKSENVLALAFEVSGQPIGFVFKGDFTTPSDAKHQGVYWVYLRNLDGLATDDEISESGTNDANIMREGTLPPGRYRLHVRQVAGASSRTDAPVTGTWDLSLEFRHQ